MCLTLSHSDSIIALTFSLRSHIVSCQAPCRANAGSDSLRMRYQHAPIIHLWTPLNWIFIHVRQHALCFYNSTFRHFHWGSVVLYIIRLLRLFTQLSSNDVTTQTALWEKCFGFCKPYMSIVMWYWAGFYVWDTDKIYLLSCWSVLNIYIYFPMELPWCYFSCAMYNKKNPLILAPEEPAEEGEGQPFSFPFLPLFFVTLDWFSAFIRC